MTLKDVLENLRKRGYEITDNRYLDLGFFVLKQPLSPTVQLAVQEDRFYVNTRGTQLRREEDVKRALEDLQECWEVANTINSAIQNERIDTLTPRP